MRVEGRSSWVVESRLSFKSGLVENGEREGISETKGERGEGAVERGG